MYQVTTTVANKSGLHARPAAAFVASAMKFKSDIRIKNNRTDKENNAKSMVMLLSLAITSGTEVTITANGADEQAAAEALKALIEGGFGEN